MRRNICNIVCRRPTTIAASFSTAVDGCGGRGRGFLPTILEKPTNVRTSHPSVKVVKEEEAKFADIFGVFSGKGRLPQSQSAVGKPLKNEDRARKAIGILFRGYAGRATRNDEVNSNVEELTKLVAEALKEDKLDLFETELKRVWGKFKYKTRKRFYEMLDKVIEKLIDKMAQDDRSDGAGATQNGRVDKLAQMRKRISEELGFTANVFHTMLETECQELDLKTCRCVYEVLENVIVKVIVKLGQDDRDDELSDGARATQNDRVDKLAEIGEDFEEELDAFLSNLLIECEPEYKKRFLEVLVKVREKMTLVTNLMNKCEPEHEKLLVKVFEKIREKSTQDDIYEKVGCEKTSKIKKLTKLYEKAPMFTHGKIGSLEEELDAFVTELFLFNLKRVVTRKPYFKAYEVIETVAKKMGDLHMRKVVEEELEAFAINLFVTNLVTAEMFKPFFMSFKLLEMIRPNGWRTKAKEEWEGKQEDEIMQKNEDVLDDEPTNLADEEKEAKTVAEASKEELDVFKTNLKIECEELDYETCKRVYEVLDKVLDKMAQDDRDDELGDGSRATQNDRVDKLAEIGEGFEEEPDASLTNLFVTNLLIECEPEYVKRFREVLVKLREKMTQDDKKLKTFLFVTNLMNKCEPEYEKLLLKVLDKVREKITKDDIDEKVRSEKMRIRMKWDKLFEEARLAINGENISKLADFEEELDAFVTDLFLSNIVRVEKMKLHFVSYEIIEKVAKKVGNENIRKIAKEVAEEELDAFVTSLFLANFVKVEIMKPFFMEYKVLEAEEEWELGWRMARVMQEE